MWKKGDFSDVKRGIVVGAGQAGLSSDNYWSTQNFEDSHNYAEEHL